MRFGILTVSDACAAGEREDLSGARLEQWVREQGHELTERSVVPDDAATITRTLLVWADGGTLDVLLTTGGTGFGPRDVTPEATRPLLQREAPGVAELLRRQGEASTPYAVLSRGLAGSRGGVLIVNLPGGPGGVEDGIRTLGPLLPHAVRLLAGESPDHRPPAGGGPP
jgi:molybdenum cofactor synthesis domain-containing protein